MNAKESNGYGTSLNAVGGGTQRTIPKRQGNRLPTHDLIDHESWLFPVFISYSLSLKDSPTVTASLSYCCPKDT